jgi:hypothetical protein
MRMAILGVVIGGALIGLLGNRLASNQQIPVWLTIACGVGGAVGGWLLFGVTADDLGGSGLLRWIVASGVAAAAVINACLAFRGDENG